MADWGPVVIAVVLFVLLTPGLLFQLPGNSRVVEFNNMQTSGVSILVHTIIYFGLVTIFLIAIGVHIYTGQQQPIIIYIFDFLRDTSIILSFLSSVSVFNFSSIFSSPNTLYELFFRVFLLNVMDDYNYIKKHLNETY